MKTPKQETSSDFANIAQPLHVPGLPVHALGSHKVRRNICSSKCLEGWSDLKYGDVEKYKLILNEHMTNSVVKHTHLWTCRIL